MSTSHNNISQFFQQKKNISHGGNKKVKSLKGKAKMVEDENNSDIEEILKKFDLDPTYGPSIGLTRIERYENAKRFGLNPPENIPSLVERMDSNISYFDR
jgi:hypothetical protein